MQEKRAVQFESPGPRQWIAALALVLPLAAVLISLRAWSGTLPAEVASHWSGPGHADATMPTGALLTGVLIFTCVPTALGMAVAVWPNVPPLISRVGLLICGGVVGVATAQWFVLVALTMVASDPLTVVLGPWVLLQFGAVAYGVLPLLIAPPS